MKNECEPRSYLVESLRALGNDQIAEVLKRDTNKILELFTFLNLVEQNRMYASDGDLFYTRMELESYLGAFSDLLDSLKNIPKDYSPLKDATKTVINLMRERVDHFASIGLLPATKSKH